MIEIRSATPDEMPELRRVVSSALAMDPSGFADLAPEMTICAFDDDRLAAVHGSWPLTMRLNGKGVPISGVTTVGTDPVDRGKGHLRKLITSHFREMHEKGERPIASLYASQAEIYQRFGYSVTSTHHSYKIEPRYLKFNEPLEIPGTLREVDAERDFPLLVDLYREFREDRTGLVHRGRAMWNAGVLSPTTAGSDHKHVVVYEEAGEPLGYMVYVNGRHPQEQHPDPYQRVVINDLVALSPLAYRAFWQHLTGFQLARHIEWPTVPQDDPLPHLLLEPRMLRTGAREGLLSRIVDLPGAMDAREYDAEGTIRVDLLDNLCTWNNGAWEIDIHKDGARTRPLNNGAPELSMTTNTFVALLFGHLSATRAARAGLVGVMEPTALARWDTLLATRYAPFCADGF